MTMKTERVAVVTGAGCGIDAASARRLAQESYVVCVNFITDAAA